MTHRIRQLHTSIFFLMRGEELAANYTTMAKSAKFVEIKQTNKQTDKQKNTHIKKESRQTSAVQFHTHPHAHTNSPAQHRLLFAFIHSKVSLFTSTSFQPDRAPHGHQDLGSDAAELRDGAELEPERRRLVTSRWCAAQPLRSAPPGDTGGVCAGRRWVRRERWGVQGGAQSQSLGL